MTDVVARHFSASNGSDTTKDVDTMCASGDIYEEFSTSRLTLCLLGSFRLLSFGRPFPGFGDKSAAVLSTLAFEAGALVSRETILSRHWPNSDAKAATRALNSLLHVLRSRLESRLGGAPVVLYEGGHYRLNVETGITIDMLCFETLMAEAERSTQAREHAAAAALYQRAIRLYSGDLCVELTEGHAAVQRERLRGQFLSALFHVADYHYTLGAYRSALDAAHSLLAHDPCREDAHRLVMECYLMLGQRAQALRHYKVCQDVLWREFQAEPEIETTLIYDQIRSGLRHSVSRAQEESASITSNALASHRVSITGSSRGYP